jgi:hypothetical protein
VTAVDWRNLKLNRRAEYGAGRETVVEKEERMARQKREGKKASLEVDEWAEFKVV